MAGSRRRPDVAAERRVTEEPSASGSGHAPGEA